jgi:hypothetical protein
MRGAITEYSSVGHHDHLTAAAKKRNTPEGPDVFDAILAPADKELQMNFAKGLEKTEKKKVARHNYGGWYSEEAAPRKGTRGAPKGII